MGARISAPVQIGPGAHPTFYTMGTGSFRGVKRPGRGVDHLPPSSAEVKGGVELYLYSTSGPSWPVIGRTLPLPLPTLYKKMKEYGDRNLKEKFWYEVCESAVTDWRELSAKQKPIKSVLILFMFFWVFPRRQIVVGRRFGTLCQFHLQRLCVNSIVNIIGDDADDRKSCRELNYIHLLNMP